MLTRPQAPSLMFAPLMLALVTMFVQQSFTQLSKAVVPILAPAALPELGASAAYVGVFVAIVGIVKIVANLGCGNVIRRYGGIRVSQFGLIMTLIAMLCGATGILWMFIFTAIFTALGTAGGTPASSHILARYSPPKYAPLIFSAKQTAVPVGLAVAGVLLPFLTVQFGWQGALVAIGILCAAFAVVLQPVRRELDADRVPDQRLSGSDIISTLMVVLRTPGLRRLSIAMFAFSGLHSGYTAYLVLYLTDQLGFTLAEAAGGVLATAMTVAIPTRVLWGYVASRWFSPRIVLCGLAVIMALACVLTGIQTSEWRMWQVLAVAILFTATGLGWQGVLLSEIARLAPKGEVGAATGGVLSFGSFGQVAVPLVFSAILILTADYSLGFFMMAVPPILACIMLLMAGGADDTPEADRLRPA